MRDARCMKTKKGNWERIELTTEFVFSFSMVNETHLEYLENEIFC